MDRVGIAPGTLLISLRQSDNTRVGAVSSAVFEGSNPECVTTQAWLIAQGSSDTELVSVGNGYWRVTGTFPFGFDGQITNYPAVPSIHDLEVSVLQTSIYRSPKLRTRLLGKHIGIVHKAVEDYRAGLFRDWPGSPDLTPEEVGESEVTQNISDAGGAPAGRTNAQCQTDGVSLFTAAAYVGIEDYISFSNVYRRTLTAASPLQVKASYDGQGKIWTSAEIMAFEGLNPNGWFQLDAGMQWLKSKPQVIAVAGQKTQVIYSYTECLIAFGLVYDAYGSAVMKENFGD